MWFYPENEVTAYPKIQINWDWLSDVHVYIKSDAVIWFWWYFHVLGGPKGPTLTSKEITNKKWHIAKFKKKLQHKQKAKCQHKSQREQKNSMQPKKQNANKTTAWITNLSLWGLESRLTWNRIVIVHLNTNLSIYPICFWLRSLSRKQA